MSVLFEQEFNSVFVLQSLPPGQRTGPMLLTDIIAPLAHERDLRVESAVRNARDRASFLLQLKEIADIIVSEGLSPILHVECHGDDERGLYLESGEWLSWDELFPPLVAINDASMCSLFIAASMCEGANMYRTATRFLRPERSDGCYGRAPFWGCVGPTRVVQSQQLSAGWSRFYQSLMRQAATEAAILGLNSALGGTHVTYVEELFARGFNAYVDRVLNPHAQAERIREVDPSGALPPEQITDYFASQLESHYYQMRSRFLFFDKYNSISTRFTMTFARAIALPPW